MTVIGNLYFIINFLKSRHSSEHYFTAHRLSFTYFAVSTPFVSSPREAKAFPTLQTIFGEKIMCSTGFEYIIPFL